VSIFSAIMNKIFHHSGQAPAATAPAAPAPTAQAAPAQPAPQAAAPAPAQPVDVEGILNEMAAHHGGGGNWRTSIVDLLKLLDLDSSLQARKELGQELNVRAGEDGSAEQNIALHRAVMQKLAENGGKVPESMKAA